MGEVEETTKPRIGVGGGSRFRVPPRFYYAPVRLSFSLSTKYEVLKELRALCWLS